MAAKSDRKEKAVWYLIVCPAVNVPGNIHFWRKR